MIPRAPRGLAWLAGAALVGAGCLPAYVRQVPPSFVSVAAPIEKVEASPTTATIVVYDAAIDTLAPKQAVTLVLKDGTVLGQAPTKSWVSFEVPPGEQTIAYGVPELDNARLCGVRTATFEAGKIYVLQRGLVSSSPDDHPERMISLMSRLRVDRAAGQERVRARWNDFWAPCIDKAEQQARKTFEEASDAHNHDPVIELLRARILAEHRPPVPFTELVIPPPP